MTSSPLTIQRRPGQNQCYDESLGAGILPLRMMQIPAGTFLMGSPEDEPDRLDREGPQQQVSVPLFFMAQYPVTQAQWRVVAALPQVNRKLDPEPSHFKGDLRPVEQMSWHDAVEFCDRLTLYTDRQYRLPSEAEWEYACRAGTTTPFHFGPTLSTDYANYDGSSEKYGAYGPGTRGEYRGKTTLVNQFEGANAFGLYDMHGNVFEWCQDPWHDSYKGAPSDGSAWIEGGDADLRVVRGGSWDDGPRYCRSAYRSFNDVAEYRFEYFGFRVCCSAPRLSQ
jgi:formylglycine-generating enzyme required for sulfatase activity